MTLFQIRWLISTGCLVLICGSGCDSGADEHSPETAQTPQPLLAPATPPGNASIAELRRQLGVGDEGLFTRTGDEITHVELFGTDVSDLSPLEGLPLVMLGISECPVTDLSPLTGMPLEQLSAQETKVMDLTPLAKSRLRELYLLGSPVADLAPLAELPITQLNLVDTKVTDLADVRKMPLHTLWIGSTEIEDLSALKGLSLVSLDIEETSISDLSPLAEMKSLRRLNIAGTEVTDLTPLAGHRLERLIFDPSRITRGLEIVREMPSLQKIGLTFEGVTPPAEFWAKYDAGK